MPFENSSIIKDAKLSKKTVKKLLNEIFSLNRDENEKEVEKFAEEKDIKRLSKKKQQLILTTTSFTEIVNLGQSSF